uniref:Uncharacterized protein n=1 Tax=Arundo donax TaxID=35708 RepID=A0A0A9BH02_ARUDO
MEEASGSMSDLAILTLILCKAKFALSSLEKVSRVSWLGNTTENSSTEIFLTFQSHFTSIRFFNSASILGSVASPLMILITPIA